MNMADIDPLAESRRALLRSIDELEPMLLAQQSTYNTGKTLGKWILSDLVSLTAPVNPFPLEVNV
jgi:hypothetical protein